MSDFTLLQELRGGVKGVVLSDSADIEPFSGDFGRMIFRTPRAIVRPEQTEDVAAAIRIANRYNIPATARGGAHSQSGQALNQGGILIDMTTLCSHFEVLENECVVDAGTLWKDVVEKGKAHKLIPPVLTNNLNVTVGGTLSVAGLGVASFRHGTQTDQCLALQVVTGTGEILDCSPTENTELFYHALCGLGQFCVITRARMKMRPYAGQIRVFYLLYDDLKTLLNDQRMLIHENRMDSIESWCTALPMGFKKSPAGKQSFGEWFYPMQLGFEFEEGKSVPDPKTSLHGLHFFKHTLTEDLELSEFANRLETLFDLWKRMGYWQNAHPWMESLLPWDMAERYIHQILQNLPPAALGGGHILLWPGTGRSSTVPLFKRPESEFVIGFGILPGVPKDHLPQLTQRLDMASELSEALGGKRYLSGYIRFDKKHWKEHFGNNWSEMKRMKKKYDPNGVLNPGFIDFSA